MLLHAQYVNGVQCDRTKLGFSCKQICDPQSCVTSNESFNFCSAICKIGVVLLTFLRGNGSFTGKEMPRNHSREREQLIMQSQGETGRDRNIRLCRELRDRIFDLFFIYEKSKFSIPSESQGYMLRKARIEFL